ncbi:hypothetical protein [Amycolatopsis sp. H20-H5]|uniref:hypothetical protein n=1 Tax=Amycolatopsis sp. H20-H5 TaxID=3046309 RepID=UPI002DB78552|nr:hypothetical protein [Amycolatopsis sp. H20-H5]MEC3976240.1 hypothetical protein [Amycolatopsis sp. H20-H5]
MSTTQGKPRVWLVAGLATAEDPADTPVVRDDLMRQWIPGPRGSYHTADGRHHANWTELRTRFDLVEVTS